MTYILNFESYIEEIVLYNVRLLWKRYLPNYINDSNGFVFARITGVLCARRNYKKNPRTHTRSLDEYFNYYIRRRNYRAVK